jgi:TolA-binding protein
VEQHAAAGAQSALCFDYYWLAEANLELGDADQAQQALDRLAAALPKLPESERDRLGGYQRQLQKKLDDRKQNGHNKH